MAYLELPSSPPNVDSGVYIGLLLGAIDDWLKLPSNWPPDDYEEAYTRMEQLKAWLVEIPNMSQGVVGQIGTFASSALPDGWLACEGQSLLRVDYPALLSAIGLVFGAADGDHFSIPDMRRNFPLGAWPTFWDIGDTGGETDHTLTIAESAPHDHTIVNSYRSTTGDRLFSAGGVVNANVTRTTSSVGGGLPHNNMPPYVVLAFAIFTGV